MKTLSLRSASATVMTLVLTASPLFASAQSSDESNFRSDEWSAQRVISSFQNAGGSTSTSFDNGSLSDSGFDFQAFYNHPCYEPLGEYLIDSCERRYGEYGNLKTASESPIFRDLLVEKFGSGILSLLGETTTDFEQQEAEDAAEEEADSDTVSFYGDIPARRIQLWNICNERFENNPAACYQDNLRLLLQQSVTISGNVYHHTAASGL